MQVVVRQGGRMPKKKGEGTYLIRHHCHPPLTPPIIVIIIIAVAVVVGGLMWDGSGSEQRMGVGVDGKKEDAHSWQCHIWLHHGVTQ